ncbi:MAG: DUF1153 domain-containing protein [Thioclava marina]|jgi:hypothetical protein|uniref:DUF1153 domain-containing protein n=1 Tax=Thioclava marina TaxID=1915077 RepID=A0ABX3MLV6_9RHOB|nr:MULTISPECIES: DUF1153 domain-containing protein [Thioclava]TNE85377.1 MAG: DUF1153 domain-containing protein [Paracoccaceae bacterium]MBC7144123.1 DUF1153 domain-containing protein [Thioclava marina]MBD3804946.1 DUF1153 domain-containing protein [Thioclava sp.]OOY12531.1 hypothetical protein BMG00_01350 [Thioclava marina]OOY28550.1 hypothetical protein BMI90_07745 [Thioclava sp. L04-15]
MYLKKVDGPRAVTLADGTILTRADLPPKETRRWVASRKATIVQAVAHGLISRGEVIDRYALSDEELDLWIEGIARHGMQGLKVTAIQKNKQL